MYVSLWLRFNIQIHVSMYLWSDSDKNIQADLFLLPSYLNMMIEYFCQRLLFGLKNVKKHGFDIILLEL